MFLKKNLFSSCLVFIVFFFSCTDAELFEEKKVQHVSIQEDVSSNKVSEETKKVPNPQVSVKPSSKVVDPVPSSNLPDVPPSNPPDDVPPPNPPNVPSSNPPKVFSYTFTNCEVTGSTGPELLACQNYYSNKLTQDPNYFKVTNGIQELVVQETGSYQIEAYGASGGSTVEKISAKDVSGGYGALVKGTIVLNKNDIVQILVGQKGVRGNKKPGVSNDLSGGGGGGTFVVKKISTTNKIALVVAGGGGGAVGYNIDPNVVSQNASILETPTHHIRCDDYVPFVTVSEIVKRSTQSGCKNSIPIIGQGASSCGGVGYSTGGAGYEGNSSASGAITTKGFSFINGGKGSVSNLYQGSSNGGFGGGGAGSFASGGGGGYTGGPCGGTTADTVGDKMYSYYGAGGGGGSYLISDAKNSFKSVRSTHGHGKVIVTKVN
jgi:hypothetical protein